MRSYLVVLLFVAVTAGSSVSTAVRAQETGAQTDQERPMRIKVGANVQAAALIIYVLPKYSGDMQSRNLRGQVVLHAIVDIDGAVKQLAVVSGPAELAPSALEAVKLWRYKQTLLNGQPVEVDTTINVDFPPEKPSTRPPASAATSVPRPDPLAVPLATLKTEAEALAAVDPETAADIRHLVELTGGRNLMAQIFHSQMAPIKDMLLQKLPPSGNRETIANRFIQMMEDRVSSDEFINLLIPVYAKHFSHDDIKSMITFFNSPPGRRFLQESSAYIHDVQEAASQHWTLVVMPELLEEMSKEFPEIGKVN